MCFYEFLSFPTVNFIFLLLRMAFLELRPKFFWVTNHVASSDHSYYIFESLLWAGQQTSPFNLKRNCEASLPIQRDDSKTKHLATLQNGDTDELSHFFVSKSPAKKGFGFTSSANLFHQNALLNPLNVWPDPSNIHEHQLSDLKHEPRVRKSPLRALFLSISFSRMLENGKLSWKIFSESEHHVFDGIQQFSLISKLFLYNFNLFIEKISGGETNSHKTNRKASCDAERDKKLCKLNWSFICFFLKIENWNTKSWDIKISYIYLGQD